MNYVALYVKTSYSMLSSLVKIEELVSRAKEYGYKAVAITDEGNMFGVMEFYNCCKKYDIKPIVGMEIAYNDKKFLLYAKNIKGYKCLIKLATIISDDKLSIDDVKEYSNDVILVMPIQWFDVEIYNIYKDKFLGYSNIKDRNKFKYNNYVYINETLYLGKDDYKYLDYLSMIKYQKVLGEYELNRDMGKYLMSPKELELDSNDIDNYNYIYNNCDISFVKESNLLPVYNDSANSYEYLKSLCEKGLNKRLNNNVSSEYKDRLEYELSVINKMGFCDYFLIVWDYVKYAKFNNILVGPGRGSAAGSLVSYTLGITDIDPIKYNLLFERFLNPERITMPDIDIDFDAEKRDLVFNYVINKYGSKRVAGIITFNTLGAKQVVRDVARVMNISNYKVDSICKLLTSDLDNSYKNDIGLRNIVNSSLELQKLYDVALHLEGLPRHVSVHAAGIIMCNKDIDEIVPLYHGQLDMYVSGYSMKYLEDLGLLKMDFLSISNLTMIAELIDRIRTNEKINITFANIPVDDKKTMDIFRDVDTDGIFQFESDGMKKFLGKLKPNNLEDLIAAIALFRPGPMDNIDLYIRRKEGKEKVVYLHDDLKPILESTYGIIIYQEQIMEISRVMAGYSYADADLLRRAMSKKNEAVILKERPRFISQSICRGYSEEVANKIFELILKFANYGFNRSHSVAYAIIAYKMAFLKKYFYKYFMTCLLSNSISNPIKTKVYVAEVRRNNVNILLPDINKSSSKYITESTGIRCPLTIIKNVGVVVINEIIREREKGDFEDFISFTNRLYQSSINKKVLTSLILAGCFDSFGYNKRTLIENLDNVINYAELSKNAGLIDVEKPLIDVYEEYSSDELVKIELDVFGFYLSYHPVSKYNNKNNSLSIPKLFDHNINIVLLIEYIKEITTKKNDVMAFVRANDEYGTIDLILFPTVYKKYNNINVGDIIDVYGKVERRNDKYQIVVSAINILNK